METLLHFWKKNCPAFGQDSVAYLEAHGRHLYYDKHRIIKHPNENLPYAYFVLEGIVGGYATGRHGILRMRELILPLDSFTGTLHPFTRRNRPIEYQALTPVHTLRLPIEAAKTGQTLHPDLGELFQIIKQRKINQLRQLLQVYQEYDHYHRYCEYVHLFPDWVHHLPHHVQYQLLQMSHASYQRVKARYLKEFNAKN